MGASFFRGRSDTARWRRPVIHEMDERLRDWAKSFDKAIEVSLGPPTDDATGEGVSLYLLDLRNIQPARTGPRPGPHGRLADPIP